MKKYIFYFLFTGVFLVSSCTSNIEVQPIAQIDASAGYQTKSDIDAALTGCYNELTNANYNGIRYWALCDLAGDNLNWTGTFGDFAEVLNHQIFPQNASVTNLWTTVYDGINRVNNVIYSVNKTSDKAVNVPAYLAEAQAFRGFQYFNLLRFYGGNINTPGYNQAGGLGLPLKIAPTLVIADTASIPRSSEADTWKFIISDLSAGVAGLPAKNGTGKINKYAAEALLARAYLYTGDWANAEAAATDVITKGGYTLVSGANYSTIFTVKNTSESIWEIQFDSQNANQGAFFTYATANGGRGEITPTISLNAAAEASDLRKPVNYTTIAPLNKTLKYTSVAGLDNFVVVRLAEMYLIRAEARANQSNLVGSLADLNIIRTRAGLTLSVAATSDDLITAIEKERRIELAFEGHRWFDMRRYNKISTLGVTQGFRALFPIPFSEVTNSGGIIAQTPGY